MRISDWSSDVCSSDLAVPDAGRSSRRTAVAWPGVRPRLRDRLPAPFRADPQGAAAAALWGLFSAGAADDAMTAVPQDGRDAVGEGLERYLRFLAGLTPESLDGLDGLVCDDVHFRDPFRDVRGRAALKAIFHDVPRLHGCRNRKSVV